MPETVIAKIKKSILPEWKTCFFSAIIFGLIAHMYKLTNWLPNWDSLVFRYDAQRMLALGRWFLSVACAPSSFYDLPWISGLMSILLHALGAVCICKMFDVRKKVTAALIGAAVITFPTVSCIMMYNYVADGYALAFLLSCIAAMLITKDKPRYIVSAILIALSVGTYQAYITVTITLLLLHLILGLASGDADVKTTIAKGFKFLLCGIVGMALYYIVLTLLLKVTQTEPLDYQGFSEAAKFAGTDLTASLYVAKESLIGYFFNFSGGVSVFAVTNCVMFLISAIIYVTNIVKNKLSPSKVLVLLALTVLLPFGACALVFINGSIDYHTLMKMGFFVFVLYFILQYEKTEYKCKKDETVKAWAIFCVSAILIFNQIIIANVSYHKLNMAYEKSYGTLVRIADRIEETDGADDCESILVLGHLPDSEAYSANLPPDMTGTTDGYILRADDEKVGQSVLCSAINDYCGKNYSFLAGKEKEELLGKFDYESMSAWPGKDSVSVVDGVIVIKMGNEV